MTAIRVSHKIEIVGRGHNFHARCACGWRSKHYPVRSEAANEASMHRLEIRYAS